jgi:hypothetical protein
MLLKCSSYRYVKPILYRNVVYGKKERKKVMLFFFIDFMKRFVK